MENLIKEKAKKICNNLHFKKGMHGYIIINSELDDLIKKLKHHDKIQRANQRIQKASNA